MKYWLREMIVGIIFLISLTPLTTASENASAPLEPIRLSGDLLLPPDVPKRLSTWLIPQADPRPGYYETSEYMMGKVAVGIIFLESNGAIDPNQENWDLTREQIVVSEILQGLEWWEDQYPYSVAKLAFFIEIHYRVPTSYEPISRPQSDEKLWIKEAMDYLGYSEVGYFDQVRNYVNDLRKRKGTDWAFAIFVVDSLVDLDGSFADGYSAYAYLGGPFLVLTYDVGAWLGIFGWGYWNIDKVTAHEVGHIFYATDEYDGKTSYSGYLYAPDSDGSGALMDKATWSLSTGTKLQIGWRNVDVDGIPDILDTFPEIVFTSMPPSLTDDDELIYDGYVVEKPYPCQRTGGRDVTINKIADVSYCIYYRGKLIGSRQISPKDGAYDEPLEEISPRVTPQGTGTNEIEFVVMNSVGNTYTTSDTIVSTYVILDRAEASDYRADVGSTQTITYHATWAHDSLPLQGGKASIKGIETTIRPDGWFGVDVRSDLVGKESYEVTSIAVRVETDRPDIITKYVSEVPPPAIIWDRVHIELYCPIERVEVGTVAPIDWEGWYEFDRAPFKGEISLDKPKAQYQMGRYSYRAVAISDFAYGLEAFTSNTIDVIFDRLVPKLTVQTMLPGSLTVELELRFESDGSPVEDATVTINGKVAEYRGNGIYQIPIPTWMPFLPLSGSIQKAGFTQIPLSTSVLAVGNLAVEVLIILLIIILGFIIIRRRT